MEPKVEFELRHPLATYPHSQTRDSVGYDVTSIESRNILPQSMTLFNTGLCIKRISEGICIQLRSRSGLGVNKGVLCCCGLIDPDYKDLIYVLLHNTSPTKTVRIEAGERIAQIVFMPVIHPQSQTILKTDVERNKGGLGSTGI